MKKESSKELLRRVTRRGLILMFIAGVLIFFFTKSPVYCIIFFVGSGISFLGYFVLIHTVTGIIEKGKSKLIFFLSGLLKMLLISVVFVIVSKYSEPAVLFYLAGLSVIVLSVMLEGGSQVLRSFKDGT